MLRLLLTPFRLNSNPALHELDDATIISELEAQGEEMVRQWSSLLSTAHMEEQANSNSANNNVNGGQPGNNNNQAVTESGCVLFSFFCYLSCLYVVRLVNNSWWYTLLFK